MEMALVQALVKALVKASNYIIMPCESAREVYKQHVHPRLSLVTAVDALCLKVLT